MTHLWETPKFMDSYQPFSNEKESPSEPFDTGYIYDSTLALIALTVRGNPEDLKRAGLLADAVVYASTHDRYYRDGRLRNAYSAKALINPQDSTGMLPGLWNEKQQRWLEDMFQISTHTGNMAWSIIALLTYYQKVHKEVYLKTALRLGEWIETQTRMAKGYGGGYIGWDENPEKISWASVEHNIDVYAAFRMLYKVTGDTKWQIGAFHARKFISGMWNTAAGHFWTGTSKNNAGVNTADVPLDVHALAIMAMPEQLEYRKAIKWVETNCLTKDDGFTGFDFNTDKDGVWFEGTAQMALAYRITNDNDKADFYIKQLRHAGRPLAKTSGMGIPAASHTSISTGFDWRYPRLLHVGATAWYIFAELHYNPFGF